MSTTEPHRRSRNYWQLAAPFAIAAVAAPSLILIWRSRVHSLDWLAGVLGAVLIFDLPVCVLILIARPDGLSLVPLTRSPEEKALRRALRDRAQLSDDEFYVAFYSQSGIPKEVPGRMRAMLQRFLGLPLAGLHPTDNIGTAFADLDFAEVLYRTEKEFDMKIPRADWTQFDGTFDSLVRYVVESRGRTGRP